MNIVKLIITCVGVMGLIHPVLAEMPRSSAPEQAKVYIISLLTVQ
ncbi:hypothetical protein [Oceanicoccus sp. KOV_DT_Chl]|nr:hypothetical protein [Oceanicoccus sp. KOV_DT_Chl]